MLSMPKYGNSAKYLTKVSLAILVGKVRILCKTKWRLAAFIGTFRIILM